MQNVLPCITLLRGLIINYYYNNNWDLKHFVLTHFNKDLKIRLTWNENKNNNKIKFYYKSVLLKCEIKRVKKSFSTAGILLIPSTMKEWKYLSERMYPLRIRIAYEDFKALVLLLELKINVDYNEAMAWKCLKSG